jgi:hypothetical protein
MAVLLYPKSRPEGLPYILGHFFNLYLYLYLLHIDCHGLRHRNDEGAGLNLRPNCPIPQ